MTNDQLKVMNALSIYARENCQHDENCSNAVKCLPACLKEIERLRGICQDTLRFMQNDKPICQQDANDWAGDIVHGLKNALGDESEQGEEELEKSERANHA